MCTNCRREDNATACNDSLPRSETDLMLNPDGTINSEDPGTIAQLRSEPIRPSAAGQDDTVLSWMNLSSSTEQRGNDDRHNWGFRRFAGEGDDLASSPTPENPDRRFSQSWSPPDDLEDEAGHDWKNENDTREEG